MKIGIKVYVYNRVMREKREEMGYTQKELAEMVGIRTSTLSDIECLKNPSLATNKLRSAMEGISSILGLDYDKVFPPEYIDALVQKRLPRQSSFEWRGEISLETLGAGENVVAGLIEAPDLEDIVDTKLLKEELDALLEDIPRREALVIKLRMGYKGRPAMTYANIGRIFGFTRQYIRQVEANGISRLRRKARIQYIFDD